MSETKVAEPNHQTSAATPNFDRLAANVSAFAGKLKAVKAADEGFPWYPYDTLANIHHLRPLIEPVHDHLFAPGTRIADIGAADGDLAFFLDSMGLKLDIIDNPPTNMNGLRGARKIRDALNAQVGILEVDLDTQFAIDQRYDFAIFLGILYHLKNPYYVMETLAKQCRYTVVSTRIARHFKAGGPDVAQVAAAYLLDADESNGDATNFWIFTEAGLKRLFSRTGWNVAGFRTIGAQASNPQSNQHDERAFALLESRIWKP